jgi:DNA-binding NtrC family response regulator
LSTDCHEAASVNLPRSLLARLADVNKKMQTPSSESPSQVDAPQEQPGFVVASPAMTELLAMADRAAESPDKVLITGESGVGKDVVARYIHSQSSRRLAPFVAVNCAGLTEARLESELFGHSKGSTTGAGPGKPGKLQLAQGGTLFLDEVGDLSLRRQARLLRFFDKAESGVDVRVIAATNRNLNDLVTTGQFREDFLQRLRVIHLHVPPLRERPEDVHVLMRQFFARSGRELRFTNGALRAFLRYRWPGNVRELSNVVEQLVWLSAAGVVGVQHLPLPMRSGPGMMAVDDPGQVADELYDALARQGASFWEYVYPMFLAHDITRDDLRELVRRGLRESGGRYTALLALFGISSRDYRRFLNFLGAHECAVARHESAAPRASDAEAGMPARSSVTTDWKEELGHRTKSRPH